MADYAVRRLLTDMLEEQRQWARSSTPAYQKLIADYNEQEKSLITKLHSHQQTSEASATLMPNEPMPVIPSGPSRFGPAASTHKDVNSTHPDTVSGEPSFLAKSQTLTLAHPLEMLRTEKSQSSATAFPEPSEIRRYAFGRKDQQWYAQYGSYGSYSPSSQLRDAFQSGFSVQDNRRHGREPGQDTGRLGPDRTPKWEPPSLD